MSDSEIKLYANSHTSQNSSAPLATHEADRPPRDWRFWCIILSLGIPLMLTAIEFTAVGTALPQIVNDLGRSQFVWVGSAYTLRSSAFLPFCGGLAQIFGQRTAMLGTLFLFGLGSVLCGASTSLNFLIAGRTVQGLGGGAIAALIQIVIADLVPLRDRGVFNGIMALAYAMGGGTGPIIGGSLAQHGNNWRWLFYLNLPICGLAAIMVVVFMRLKMPKAPLLVQFSCMDWIGNFLIVSSTMAIVIALTFGGLQFAWKMANVPLPLILGLLGLCAFLVYEILVAAHPIIPVRIIVTDRMTLSGYIQNFLNAMILATLSYWLPVYFQACKGASPMASGVDIFGISFTVSPFAVIAGGVVQKLAKYRPPIWFRWSLTIIGLALLTLVWGVTVGGAILQNELDKRLLQAFITSLPNARGSQLAFTVIPLINGLEGPLKTQVRAADADAMQVVWEVLVGIAGTGLLVSLAMKHFPLHMYVNSEWGREEDGGRRAGHAEVNLVELVPSRGDRTA